MTKPSPRSLALLTRRRALLLAGGALAAPSLASAQEANWPSRPITLVVPFGTGGGTDVTARLISPRLSEILRTPIVVDNRPGAGSTVGTDYVAKSPPDGYRFVLATLSSTGVAAGLYPNLPYDPVRDLTAVAPTNFVPICHTITRRGLNPRDTAEWVAMLRASPGRYSYGSNGVGSTGHIASSNFLQKIGAEGVHIPYRGAGQVLTAMLAGEVHFNSDIPGLMLPYVRSGDMRTLFIATEERSSLMPDVPTAAEVGLPDYKAYSWFGIFGPRDLPRPIVERMNAAIDQVLGEPAINRRLEEIGTPAMRGYTPERFAQYVRDEIDIWVPIVRASGARAE